MTYEEFLEGRRTGNVKISISPSLAMKLVDHLPKRYQAAHIFWSWVWMLSIPAFIGVSIFWKWWAGILLLFFLTPAISTAVKKSAAQFVLEHAAEDEEFFTRLVERNLLIVEEI